MKKVKKRTFVMGDLHGACKALEQCLLRCDFDLVNDTLIQLGDICDGHCDVYECVDTLLQIPNLIAIKGNHDAWLLEFIETDFHPMYWTYGGLATLKSYLNQAGKPGLYRASGSGYKTGLEASDIPQSHKDFFAAQKLIYVDDQNRCYVHSGFKANVAFEQQQETDFYLNRKFWSEMIAESNSRSKQANFGFKAVYLGHTSTLQFGMNQPMKALNTWNLDTGAGNKGRLTIMDVDTEEYWQSDPVNDLYPERIEMQIK